MKIAELVQFDFMSELNSQIDIISNFILSDSNVLCMPVQEYHEEWTKSFENIPKPFENQL